MASKRQLVQIERPDVGSAALPAICYLPSLSAEGGAASHGSEHELTGQSFAKRLRYQVHAKLRSSDANVQLVHASLGDIEYVGSSHGSENAGAQPCSYALGVYKPEEGKLEIVGVAADRLFRLDPRLAGLVYEPTGAGGAGLDRDGRKEAAKRLVDQFGSTRRRRQLTAREAGVVAADRISGGAAVQELLGNVASKGADEGITREEVQRQAFAQRTVPPHNPKATTASEAYPLDKLLAWPQRPGQAAGKRVDLAQELNTAQMHKLAEDPEELTKAREKQWVSPYIVNKLAVLRSLKSSDKGTLRAKTLARQLALLAGLLRLMSRPVLSVKEGGMSGLAQELRLRDNLAEFLIELFYVRTEDPLRGVRYERTDAQRQLLLSYVLAVAMVAEEGCMDGQHFEELRTALKLDATKLTNALQQLGCTTKAVKAKIERDGHLVDASSYEVTLLKSGKTLAESFPEIKMGRGKGKGKGKGGR